MSVPRQGKEKHSTYPVSRFQCLGHVTLYDSNSGFKGLSFRCLWRQKWLQQLDVRDVDFREFLPKYIHPRDSHPIPLMLNHPLISKNKNTCLKTKKNTF